MAPDGLRDRRHHCIGKQWARISVVHIMLDAYRRYDTAGASADDDDDDANLPRSDS